MTLSRELFQVLTWLIPLIHLLGLSLVFDAIWNGRSAQGSTAWIVGLVAFPYLAIPLYLIFGRGHFHGYIRARQSHDAQLKQAASTLLSSSQKLGFLSPDGEKLPAFRVLEHLARLPFTRGHKADLLIDGEATFSALFAACEKAEHYILIQFFIARDDAIGCALSAILERKAAAGVRVYYLYDEIGSHATSSQYWKNLQKAGAATAPFNSRRGGWRNRFQLNFRNHRKITVIDGLTAFVGGHNLGDDYLGKGPIGPWRDTHVQVEGPSVAALQLSFLEDWYWARGEVIAVKEEPKAVPSGDLWALALPTGPADRVDVCSLMFCELIQAAEKRLWIASPYFVPDVQVLSQLKLAALRGVDVRIILPEQPDHLLPYLAAYSYIEAVESLGVRFYRLTTAFPHQKVVLIDSDGVAVGSANLDNRSLYLNFEVTMLFAGRSLAEATERMLTKDMDASRLVARGELQEKSWFFRLGVRAARLLAPIL